MSFVRVRKTHDNIIASLIVIGNIATADREEGHWRPSRKGTLCLKRQTQIMKIFLVSLRTCLELATPARPKTL